MGFVTKRRELASLFIFVANIWQIYAAIYYDYVEFKRNETLEYGILDVGTNLDSLNSTERFPQFKLFTAHLKAEHLDGFCQNFELYLKDKEVFLYVDIGVIDLLTACLKIQSKRSLVGASKFSVTIGAELAAKIETIRQLQILGVKLGLRFSNSQNIKSKLDNFRKLGVTVDIILYESINLRHDVNLYDFNSFVKLFNEAYLRLRESSSGYDPLLILSLGCSNCNDQYNSFLSSFAYRWGELMKRFVVGSHYSSCKRHEADELGSWYCLKENIVNGYRNQPLSFSVKAYKDGIKAMGPILETPVMCKYFQSVFIEIDENFEINVEALMRLAFVHSNLPCKLTWNVRWHVEKSRNIFKNQSNPNHIILSNLARKNPGLIDSLYIVLPRITCDYDYGAKSVKLTLEEKTTGLNISLNLVELVQAGSDVYNQRTGSFNYSHYLNTPVGASIDFVGSLLRTGILEYVAEEHGNVSGTRTLIGYAGPTLREEGFGGCLEFKKQWNTLTNWAGINSFHVVVESLLSSTPSDVSVPWFKGVSLFGNGFSPENATSDELRFLSNFLDTCVTLPEKIPIAPTSFSGDYSGITLTLTSKKYSRLEYEEIAALIQLIHFKFNKIEIIPQQLCSIVTIQQAIELVEERAGVGFTQYQYYLNIGSEDLSRLNSYDVFAGVHVRVCFCEKDVIIFKRLQKASVKNAGISMTYEESVTPDNYELLKSLFPLTDYVVIEVNLAEAVLFESNSFIDEDRQNLNQTFNHYIQYSSKELIPNQVFDNLRAARFNIKRFNQNCLVYMQIAWPTITNKKSAELTQKIWEFLNDFSIVFDFPFFINDAFDQTKEEDLKYGWWKLLNDSDVGNPENYIDKQSEFYALETRRGKSFRKTSTSTQPTNSIPTTEIIAGVMFFLLLIICAGAVVIYKQRQTLHVMLTKEEIEQFEMGTNAENQHDNDYCSIAYDKNKYEIGKKSFTLESSQLIGSGNFGLVYKATIPNYDKPVAVKVPKICGKVELLSVLREIKLLSFVGEHENILKLVGAYTREIRKGIVYVITEFVEHGSLLEYLRKIGKTDCEKEGMLVQLSKFCLEIAKGMHFLSDKKVVHGDLSARNVLLDSCNVCKISDFGLSRKLYYMDLYVKQTAEPVPWKWMAVEALERSELSLKSDIWSLGVTIWEIYSFAEEPYQSFSWDLEFSKKLKNGLRLPKPEMADQSIYEAMLTCWKIDPDERPNTDYFINFFQCLRNTSYTHL